MLKRVGYLMIALLCLGATSARAQEKGAAPDLTKVVSPHLTDLLEREKALVQEITKSNDQAAAFNKRQSEVVNLVEQTLSELRRHAGPNGNAKAFADARQAALSQLLKLDASKDIRSLADFNAFIRHVGQIQGPGEDPAAFKARTKGQNEAGEVLAAFRKTYLDKSQKAVIEKGREDNVRVEVTNPKTLQADVKFKEHPNVPTDGMKAVMDKLGETKKAFEACPTPEKLKLEVATHEKAKAAQESILTARRKSLAENQPKLTATTKQLDDIGKTLRKAVEKAFVVKGFKGTDPRFDTDQKVVDEVYSRMVEGMLTKEYDPFRLNKHRTDIEDPRKSLYDPETRWGRFWFKEVRLQDQYDRDVAKANSDYAHNVETARSAIVTHALEQPWSKGGFMLNVLQHAMAKSGARFTMSVDLDQFRELIGAIYRAHQGTEGGGHTPVPILAGEAARLGAAIQDDQGAIAAAEAELRRLNERLGIYAACLRDLPIANNAVMGVRFQPGQGLDPQGKAAIDQAHGLYQQIQQRLRPLAP